MRYKLTFAVGFAIGYTLGSRAGRERYEQIMSMLRGAAESPAVQSAAGVLQAQASDLADSAKRVVRDKVRDTVGAAFRGSESAPPPYPGATIPTSPNGESSL